MDLNSSAQSMNLARSFTQTVFVTAVTVLAMKVMSILKMTV